MLQPLDFHDDPIPLVKYAGTIVPDFVKKYKPKAATLHPDCYALKIFTKTGSIEGRFRLDNKAETWLSAWYLGHNAHRIPEKMTKAASALIVKAASGYELELPGNFTIPDFVGNDSSDNLFSEEEFQNFFAHSPNQYGDMAKLESQIRSEHGEKTAAFAFCSLCSSKQHKGYQHAAASKLAGVSVEELSDQWFGVVAEGLRYYPLHTPVLVKKAEGWFQEHGKELDPGRRWEFSIKLAKAAHAFSMALDRDSLAWDYLSPDYTDEDHLKTVLGMRKVACPEVSLDAGVKELTYQKALDKLFEKRANLDPFQFAVMLENLDKLAGAASSWDNVFPDPFASVFHMDKVAEFNWHSRYRETSVSGSQLKSFVKNPEACDKNLRGHLNKETIEAFVSSPVIVFHGLPDPEKELLLQVLRGEKLSRRLDEEL